MGKKKILIADDEERITNLVKDYLESNGYETVVCFNGEEAVKAIKNDSSIELALMDIMMPELDGCFTYYYAYCQKRRI